MDVLFFFFVVFLKGGSSGNDYVVGDVIGHYEVNMIVGRGEHFLFF
jgi:hypothetical protein